MNATSGMTDNSTVKNTLEFALGAFNRIFEQKDEASCALVAMTLYMIKGHSPHIFNHYNLTEKYLDALQQLKTIPLDLHETVSQHLAQARVDAYYVLNKSGNPPPQPNKQKLLLYFTGLCQKKKLIYAWVLTEMLKLADLDLGLNVPISKTLGRNLIYDKYVLTHRVLLENDYLNKDADTPNFSVSGTDLINHSQRIMEEGHLDILCEIIFCLQALKESKGKEYMVLLQFLLDNQDANGYFLARKSAQDGFGRDHTTCGALIALAGHLGKSL